jgi:peptide/nickel transport system substrate-binding protein
MAHSIFSRTRLPIVALAAGALLLTACGSSSSSGGGGPKTSASPKASTAGGTGAETSTTVGEYGSLPAASGTPTTGGTITYGIISGSQPNFIFPITPSADGSIYNQQFYDLLWEPLYNSSVSDRPILDYNISVGNAPVYSDGNKTVTLNLKPTYKWSNGAPVDAKDVEFFIDELKAAVKESPDNFGDYTPGDFPDNVSSMQVTGPDTLVLHITKAYNPSWFTETQLNVVFPFPSTSWAKASASGPQLDFTKPANAKKIYNYLIGQAKKPADYATDPLWKDVDGPFTLTKFNAATGANTVVPNTAFSGTPKPTAAAVKAVYFTSSTAMFNQLRAGTLDLSSPIDPTDLPQVPQLKAKGYNIWGYPDLGFNYLDFNFKDTTGGWNKIIGQLYIRQALAHLQNEPAVIKGVYDGAAATAFGPVPAIPATAYVPANAVNTPYSYSTAAASQLLTSHGWKVAPSGTTTCQSAGTAANQCGAGIKKGANLNFTVYYTNDPSNIGEQVTALASSAKTVGINITPVSKTFNYIIQNQADSSSPANDNKWQAQDFGGFTEDIYPTTDEIFNTTGSFNQGGYSDPKADALIKASEFSSNPNAVKNEATYITEQLPAIFQPNPDLIYAWKGISGPPDSFAALSQYGLNPQYWYVTK